MDCRAVLGVMCITLHACIEVMHYRQGCGLIYNRVHSSLICMTKGDSQSLRFGSIWISAMFAPCSRMTFLQVVPGTRMVLHPLRHMFAC